MRYLTNALLLLLVLCSCNNKNITNQPFKRPEVPSIITDKNQAVSYIAEHFWDNFLSKDRLYPKDTALFAGINKADFRTFFAEYATFLLATTPYDMDKAQKHLADMVEQAEKRDTSMHFRDAFSNMEETFFFNTESPFRNEECYLYWIQAVLDFAPLTKEEQLRISTIIPYLQLNRIGNSASDFPFSLKTGEKKTLGDISADYILLIFSNPACPDCSKTINEIKSIPQLNNLISSGKLAIITLFPDENIHEWLVSLREYPENWINGFDCDNTIEDLYYLRAIPSLYLLGKNRIVIEKDAPVERIVQQITSLL